VSIVDDLRANPGLYIGTDHVEGTDMVGGARIVVTALPGHAGVSLDYEVLNGLSPRGVLGHAEHTVIGRTDDGRTMMVIAHTHGEGLTVLYETDPGVFELGRGPAPFPMKVVVSVPEPGRIRHAWWYGPADGEAVERDVAELERVTF
jgi:hypothetical protein